MAASDNLNPSQFPAVDPALQSVVEGSEQARQKRMDDEKQRRAETRRIRMTTNPWDPSWR